MPGIEILLALTMATAAPPPAPASTAADLPVLLETPPCDHDRLGRVEVEVGQKVTESTDDDRVPTTRLSLALGKLQAAAAEGGANAVVLRGHQAVFFTHHGRRSAGPVYIKLKGALITLPADVSSCRLVFVDPRALERRMRTEQPETVTSGAAYAF